LPLAPFPVEIVPIGKTDGEEFAAALKLHDELLALGVDVLLDDRDERPGVKFKDADLIGIPLRVTVGKKALADHAVELKVRGEKDFALVPLTEIVGKLKGLIDEAHHG